MIYSAAGLQLRREQLFGLTTAAASAPIRVYDRFVVVVVLFFTSHFVRARKNRKRGTKKTTTTCSAHSIMCSGMLHCCNNDLPRVWDKSKHILYRSVSLFDLARGGDSTAMLSSSYCCSGGVVVELLSSGCRFPVLYIRTRGHVWPVQPTLLHSARGLKWSADAHIILYAAYSHRNSVMCYVCILYKIWCV